MVIEAAAAWRSGRGFWGLGVRGLGPGVLGSKFRVEHDEVARRDCNMRAWLVSVGILGDVGESLPKSRSKEDDICTHE